MIDAGFSFETSKTRLTSVLPCFELKRRGAGEMLERGEVEGVKRWVNEWLTPPPGPSGKESLQRLVSAAACLPLSALLEDNINNLAKIASGEEVSKQQVVLLLVGRQAEEPGRAAASDD